MDGSVGIVSDLGTYDEILSASRHRVLGPPLAPNTVCTDVCLVKRNNIRYGMNCIKSVYQFRDIEIPDETVELGIMEL